VLAGVSVFHHVRTDLADREANVVQRLRVRSCFTHELRGELDQFVQVFHSCRPDDAAGCGHASSCRCVPVHTPPEKVFDAVGARLNPE